ncbi:hypothetical protein E2562_006839 [Oryza meyeriana var. granulata]|uniref:Uncharacterized protein n=1 Tax=Oryza meyeriana var. granulata TaxID=110450 RepID=A0A6G1C5R1_9ORYZ|nr:hypothetical protein E2562_006839 [Oryza meyeriana var. granulata]
MDEKEFRRMLELFPVVRSRDYCVIHPHSPFSYPTLSFPAHAESGTSSKGTTQKSRAQEATGGNKNESADLFMRKLKMAVEKKVGATKAELFCKTFEETHKKLIVLTSRSDDTSKLPIN